MALKDVFTRGRKVNPGQPSGQVIASTLAQAVAGPLVSEESAMRLSFDGLVGMSPIAYARETLGLGMAAEEFGSRFFKDGTHLGGVISVPGTMSDEGFQRTKTQFAEMYRGMQRAHTVPLLEDGATYTPVGIPPEDAQFLETRKYQRSDIAGIYRVPPHLIGDLEKATFSNIEHQDLAYLQRTLLPWLTRWEQAFWYKLPVAERGKYLVEHDTGSFMRGDTKSRMEAYSLGINAGVLTVNEVRERENLNPVEGGDVLRVPLNMQAAAGEDPPQPKQAPPARSGFDPGGERRTVDEAKAALVFTGVSGRQFDALRGALRAWLADEARGVGDLVDRFFSVRSAEDQAIGNTLIGRLRSYYGDLERALPESLRDPIESIAAEAYRDACADLGALSPPREWFDRRLEFFYGDEAARLRAVSLAELEAVIRKAGENNAGIYPQMQRFLADWPEDRAGGMAKTEAAFIRNKMLIRTIRKGGYIAVWSAAPSCCSLCQALDGQAVITLSPPLHRGCSCTVKRGGFNADYASQYNAKLPEDQGLREPSDGVMLSVRAEQFGQKFGKHAAELGLDVQDPAARDAYRQLIFQTFYFPDEQRLVDWFPDPATGERTIPGLFRIKNGIVVLTETNGQFRSLYPIKRFGARLKKGKVIPLGETLD